MPPWQNDVEPPGQTKFLESIVGVLTSESFADLLTLSNMCKLQALLRLSRRRASLV